MPAPRLGAFSGARAAGYELERILAAQAESRILAAKAAEEQRRQLLKEQADAAAAAREEAKAKLERDKFEFDKSKPVNRPTSQITGAKGPNDTRQSHLIYSDTGDIIRSYDLDEPPPAPPPTLVSPGVKTSPGLTVPAGAAAMRITRQWNPRLGDWEVKLVEGEAPPPQPPETYGPMTDVTIEGKPRVARGPAHGGPLQVLPEEVQMPETDRPPTQFENTQLGYYSTAKHGFDRMTEIENNRQNPLSENDLLLMQSTKYAPDFVAVAGMSPQGQAYHYAYWEGLTSRIRALSGAATPESEYNNYLPIMALRAGDVPSTYPQKREARDYALNEMAVKAGKAFEWAYGYRAAPLDSPGQAWERDADGKLVRSSRTGRPGGSTAAPAPPAAPRATPPPQPPRSPTAPMPNMRPSASHGAPSAAPSSGDTVWVRDPASGRLVQQSAR